jgi:hypothetical protein
MKEESNDSQLARAMAKLAAEHRVTRAPRSVEQAVLTHFEASRRRGVWRIAAFGAIAATVVVGVVAGRLFIHQAPIQFAKESLTAVKPATAETIQDFTPAKPVVRPHRLKRTSIPPQQQAADAAPFIAIPYTVPPAPDERLAIVRMTLSPAAVTAVGLPFTMVDPARDRLADVLVGEDGRVRAVRLVADSSFR